VPGLELDLVLGLVNLQGIDSKPKEKLSIEE
jgi:hypothetical protein